MKKYVSLLLSLVMMICMIPLSTMPVYAETYISQVSVTYDDKAVAVRTDFTEKEVSKLFQDAMNKAVMSEGIHIDTSCSGLAKRTGSGMVSYIDFEKVFTSDELVDSNADYYFIINLEENEGFWFDTSALPYGEVNDDTVYVSWYSTDFTTPEGSIDLIIPVDTINGDYVSEVEVSPEKAKVQIGHNYQFSASVTGTDDRISWSVEGTYTSSGTKVVNGKLYVGSDETSTFIRVRATSIFNSNVFDEVPVVITEYPIEITGITIDPPSAGIKKGDRQYFDINVQGTDYPEYTAVLLGRNSGQTYLAYDTVYVGDDETASTLTLRVTSVRDPSVSEDAVITVLPPDTIPDLIEIGYDHSSLDVLSADLTGQEVTGLLRSALNFASISNGVYIDTSSSCLARRTGTGMVSYSDFVKLSDSTDTLDPNEDYYFFINLEETGGYVFDTDSLPEAKVNGKYADAVSWYSVDLTKPTGSIDVIVKANVDGSSHPVASVEMTPTSIPTAYLDEGYGFYDFSVDITVTNTGDVPLKMTSGEGSAITCSNPHFNTWAGGIPSVLQPGQSHTRTLHMDTGLGPGTYETDVIFRDLEHLVEPVSVHAKVIVQGVIDRIDINMPKAYAGKRIDSYNYSLITTGEHYHIYDQPVWCIYDEDIEAYTVTGRYGEVFEMGKTYYLNVELMSEDLYQFRRTETYTLAVSEYYLNGNRVYPKFYGSPSEHFNGSNWVSFYIPFKVTEEGGLTVFPYPASAFTEGTDYTVDGQYVIVYGDTPCKVGYLSGGNYERCSIYSYAGSRHTFYVPDGVDEVILVVRGDSNKDGTVNLGDASRIKAAFRKKLTLDPVELFGADVNNDGSANLGDAAQITAAFRKKFTIPWL
ncbi:MAG: hypothetical protein J5528_00110 [Firmicutes bacterium]|nr:hypothetical protein [Bacillota bacterium]